MTEYSEQSDSIKKADFLAFAIMMLTLLLSIVQIILSSNPDVQVTAKLYTSSVNNFSEVSYTNLQEILQDAPININTADEELLKTLNGIGDKKAAAIIEYRDKNGPFSSIEEIMEVNGIGEKIFETIKDNIKV